MQVSSLQFPASTSSSNPPVWHPHLDGIRALAVTVVMAFHVRISGFSGGFAGVGVFFVMSGYLIASIHGLYLWHYPLIRMPFPAVLEPVTWDILAAVAALMIAWVSWRLIEDPIRRRVSSAVRDR